MVCEELTLFIPLNNVFPLLGFFHDFPYLRLSVVGNDLLIEAFLLVFHNRSALSGLERSVIGIWHKLIGIFSHVVLHILLLFLLHTLYRYVIPLLVTHSS